MITYGIGSILLLITAMGIAALLSIIVFTVIDRLSPFRTVYTTIIQWFIAIIILILTITPIVTILTNLIIKNGKLEKTTDGTIVNVMPGEISYVENNSHKFNTVVSHFTPDEIKPTLDKNLKLSQIRISTYTSVWGSYNKVTFNLLP